MLSLAFLIAVVTSGMEIFLTWQSPTYCRLVQRYPLIGFTTSFAVFGLLFGSVAGANMELGIALAVGGALQAFITAAFYNNYDRIVNGQRHYNKVVKDTGPKVIAKTKATAHTAAAPYRAYKEMGRFVEKLF